jgi:hypothetical protein
MLGGLARLLLNYALAACMRQRTRDVCGAVAQLGERLVRNEEASGSIPLSSTK